MKKSLIAKLSLVSVVLAMSTFTVRGQSGEEKNPPAATQSDKVMGSGCVEAGVEAGCIVLKDAKSGTLYNLFFKGKKPTIGSAIQFSGTTHDGPTTCMQGKPVNVTEWKPSKMKCGKQSRD